MACMISKQTGNAIVAYVDYTYSPTVCLQYLSCYVALILPLLTVAYIIMTMHAFSMNIAGGIIFGAPACPAVPLMSGHLQCTDTVAWSRGCPFMTGTTVYVKLVHSYSFITQNCNRANSVLESFVACMLILFVSLILIYTRPFAWFLKMLMIKKRNMYRFVRPCT